MKTLWLEKTLELNPSRRISILIGSFISWKSLIVLCWLFSLLRINQNNLKSFSRISWTLQISFKTTFLGIPNSSLYNYSVVIAFYVWLQNLRHETKTSVLQICEVIAEIEGYTIYFGDILRYCSARIWTIKMGYHKMLFFYNRITSSNLCESINFH